MKTLKVWQAKPNLASDRELALYTPCDCDCGCGSRDGNIVGYVSYANKNGGFSVMVGSQEQFDELAKILPVKQPMD